VRLQGTVRRMFWALAQACSQLSSLGLQLLKTAAVVSVCANGICCVVGRPGVGEADMLCDEWHVAPEAMLTMV